MSAVENGLPANSDSKTKVQKGIDKNIPSGLKIGSDATTSEFNNDHSNSCNGNTSSDQLQSSSDADLDYENISSPDISLSSQKTLRYCDVEPELRELNYSQKSSVLSDASDAQSNENQPANLASPKLPVTQDMGFYSLDSLDKLDKGQTDQGLPGFSEDHLETFPEFNYASRPESLSISHPAQVMEQELNRSKLTGSKNNIESEVRVRNSSQSQQSEHTQELVSHHSESDVCLPQNLPQGTIIRKGDMIQFVAADLMEKIKKSSPMSHTDTTSTGSRRSSVRSTASASSSTSFATSSGVSRSPSSLFQQSPDDIPPIDASAVIDLENHAHRVADSLDLMMGNIRNNLHKMSAITIGCQDAYKRSVDITCDSVDASIKSMYALMAKCEELNSTMKPVEQLAIQIREIKRILDLFEAQMTDK